MSSTLEVLSKRSIGRPRSGETHRAILKAAADLLEREPYCNISVDRLASEARVGKQTIYRWWDTKGDRMLEAYLDRIKEMSPKAKPTGDTIEDLRADLYQVASRMNQPGAAMAIRGLYCEAQLDETFRSRFCSIFLAELKKDVKPFFDAGIASGAIRKDVNSELIIEILYGGLSHRLLTGFGPVNASHIDELIEIVRPAIELPPSARRTAPQRPAWLC